MSTPWLKWYPTDWRADAGLRQCSMAARGLWIELLGYMHEAEPYGFFLINGRKPTNAEIGRLVGIHHNAVTPLVTELVTHGVTGVAFDGVMFSRRMVRDHQKALKNKENGYKGGNPELFKTVNPELKAQKPEARVQNPESKTPLPPEGVDALPKVSRSKPRIPLPDNFELTLPRRTEAKANGVPIEMIDEEFAEFRRYWHSDGRSKNNWDGVWGERCRSIAKRLKQQRGKQPERDDMWS